jgi:lysophospholipase L1-like esterase
MKRYYLQIFLLAGMLACAARSGLSQAAPTQTPSASAPTAAPAVRLAPHPTTLEDAQKLIDGYWKRLEDWPQLARYRDANTTVGVPKPGENRVVFMGDSITDGWKLADDFPGKPYVNRGIGGQTTPQMLIRFRPDVIDLKPRVVVILAGTNDIAGNTGPVELEDIERNFESMAELARVNDIRVVLASVMPVHDAGRMKMTEHRPPEKIRQLNDWLKQYAAQHKLVYLDYFSAMVDPNGLMRPELANDGLHPNATGYKLIAPLAEQAIERALKQKK